MKEMFQPGSYWWYKDKQYRVVAYREDLLLQDAMGNWVPAVIYESEALKNKEFARPWTEFGDRFSPKFV